MQVLARVVPKPAAHFRRLVGCVVIQDRMDDLAGGEDECAAILRRFGNCRGINLTIQKTIDLAVVSWSSVVFSNLAPPARN